MDAERMLRRDVARSATPGPWGWRGHQDSTVELRGPSYLGAYDARIVSALNSEPCIVTEYDPDHEWGGIVSLTHEACEACRKVWDRVTETGSFDPLVDHRCPKPENMGTVWVCEPGHGHIVPINRFATREVEHRDDVIDVTHPDASHIALNDPSMVIADLDRIERLEALVRHLWVDAMSSAGIVGPPVVPDDAELAEVLRSVIEDLP